MVIRSCDFCPVLGGEALAATRSDLILPRDGALDTAFILLRIQNPKMRGRAARHQSSRIDQPDIIQLIDTAFASLQPAQRLWPFSSGTLRRRLNLVQQRLGLCSAGKPHSDLSSLRRWGRLGCCRLLNHRTSSDDGASGCPLR